ncbi:hypothetical protein HDU96_002670 [Phlyctochytrium bullatum]|nr:hypothetical protein HDU96_002670 [Phlyctochytrium bullatum]
MQQDPPFLESLSRELALLMLPHLEPSSVVKLLLTSHRMRSLFMLSPQEYGIARKQLEGSRELHDKLEEAFTTHPRSTLKFVSAYSVIPFKHLPMAYSLGLISWKDLRDESFVAIFPETAFIERTATFMEWQRPLRHPGLIEKFMLKATQLNLIDFSIKEWTVGEPFSFVVAGMLDSVRLLERLMERSQTSQFTAAMNSACYTGAAGIARNLITSGFDAGSEEARRYLKFSAENGHLDITRMLVEHGVDINAKDEDGSTLLHNLNLGYPGNVGIAQLLIEKGAELEARDEDGKTPLHRAAFYNSHDIARLLVENGADLEARDVDACTPLHHATCNANLEFILLLVEKGADIRVTDANGSTPIHDAASEGNFDAVKLFIERGADVNGRDRRRMTPLHYACANDCLQVVELLLESGADAHAMASDYSTPLLIASQVPAALDIVRLLLEKGADVDARDGFGTSPLHHAAKRCILDVVRLLLERGAMVDGRDFSASTPLHGAAQFGHVDVVRLLVEKGADIRARNNSGSTPIDVWNSGRSGPFPGLSP